MLNYFLVKIKRSIIWVKRFRKRKGYGVHSPFAFQFITGVIYEKLPYYKYEELKKVCKEQEKIYSKGWKYKDIKVRKLLFRLANFIQPQQITIIGQESSAIQYLHAGCNTATIQLCKNIKNIKHIDQNNKNLILLHSKEDNGYSIEDINIIMTQKHAKSMLIIDDIYKDNKMRHLWQSCINHPNAGITFDLYEIGLIFFDKSKIKQDYIVNF